MEKINFLGIPMNVMSAQDVDNAAAAGGQHLYGMIRVADMDLTAGSTDLRRRRLRTPCEDCGEICFFDPKSTDALRGLNLIYMCIQCLAIRTKKEGDAKDD